MSIDLATTTPLAGRLFFALWLPPATRSLLHSMAGGIVGRSGGRLMREEDLHLTLAFLGEVPESRLPALLSLAEGLILPRVPVRLDKVAYWAHNHVLYAGANTLDPALLELANSLQETLKKEGFLLETRSFVPHVTMLRKLLHPGKLPSLPPQEWVAEKWALVRSWRSDRGAAYETLAQWPLQAP